MLKNSNTNITSHTISMSEKMLFTYKIPSNLFSQVQMYEECHFFSETFTEILEKVGD